MIEELAPESGSALMEKLVLVPLSSFETVTRIFGVGRLADDDDKHTAIDVRLAVVGDRVLFL